MSLESSPVPWIDIKKHCIHPLENFLEVHKRALALRSTTHPLRSTLTRRPLQFPDGTARMLCITTVGSSHTLPVNTARSTGRRRPLRGCVASPSSEQSGALRLFDETAIQRLYPSRIYGTNSAPGSCTLPPMGWNRYLSDHTCYSCETAAR